MVESVESEYALILLMVVKPEENSSLIESGLKISNCRIVDTELESV